MTWAHALPTALAALVILLGPGYLIARALGLARLQALAGAPALAMTAIGALSVILHLGGVPWTPGRVLTSMAVMLVVTLSVVIGAVYVARRSQGRIAERAEPAWVLHELAREVTGGPRPWWPVPAAVAATAALTTVGVTAGIGAPDTPMQASDGVWHLNALAYIRHLADAYPIGGTAPMYWGDIHYYPTGWHALAAVLPGEPTVVANTLMVLGVGLLWPLGCASLLSAVCTATSRTLLGGLPLIVGILASGIALGPTVLASMIWPYTWSVCLLPGVLGLVMVARPRSRPARRQGRSVVGAWTAVLLACLGLVAVHGASVFNLAMTAVPALVLVGILALLKAWRDGGRSRRWVIALGVVSGLGLLVGARGFSDQLLMLFRYKRGGADPWAVVGEIVRDDAMVAAVRIWGPGATSLTVVALLGAVVVLVRQRYRWAPLVAGVVAFLMVTSVLSGSPFQRLSSPWYVQRARLDPLLEMALLILVMAAVEAARDHLLRVRARQRHDDQGPAWPGRALPLRLDIDLARLRRIWLRLRVPVATAVLAAVVLASLMPLAGRWHQHEKVEAASYRPVGAQWRTMLAPGEVDFIRRTGAQIPEGAVVLGVPTNGSAYYWALTGHEVVYPTLRPYTETDRRYVAANASQILFDPEVCAALQRLGAGYLYVDSDPTEGGAAGGGEIPRFATTIDQIPVEALEVVDQEGSWTLYRISYCPATPGQGS